LNLVKQQFCTRSNATIRDRLSRQSIQRRIIPAIAEARENGTIRLIDYIFVMKDSNGDMMSIQGTDLGRKEIEAFDSVLGALLGLGAGGMEGAIAGAEAGAKYGEYDMGFTERDVKNIAEEIPNNSSALLMVVEHLWTKKIKEALVNANGIMIAQGMLTPELVVMIGAALKL
jgi:uncharacterized membrane protein